MRPYRGLVHRIAGPTVLTLALAMSAGGCAYIGQVTFEEKRDSLDHDKDGSPLGGPDRDCDDYEANETPGKPEIPYDGFDNDCDGADMVDADGDGYPGILKEDYLAQFPDAEWPTDLNEALDCADDPAVFPTAASINPGVTSDPPYDGIDSDCAGDNDFDRDDDGYMPDAADLDGTPVDVEQAFAAYIAAWGYTELESQAQFGDCNDFRAEANPGVSAQNDAWYDGHDDDCAGNNDFDADADGYMPNQDPDDGSDLAAAYQDFVESYHPGGAPWTEQWDDCLDMSVTGGPPGNPADVYPGNNTDAVADGVDSDCACDNDYDADEDGTMPDTAANDFDAYDQAWGCGLTPVYGDCDDNDPDAYPGAIERLGDAADSDCDGGGVPGGEDTTPFYFDPALEIDNPRPPRITKNNNHYIVLLGADYTIAAGSETVYGGYAMSVPLTAGYLAQNDGAHRWHGSTSVNLEIGNVIDVGPESDNVWTALNYSFESTSGYNSIRRLLWNGTAYSQDHLEWDTVSSFLATGADIEVDQFDYPWFVTCAEDTLTVNRADDNGDITPFQSISPTPLTPAGVPSGVCFWDAPPTALQTPDPGGAGSIYTGNAQVVSCEPGVDCTTYDYDTDANSYNGSLTVAATNPWAGRQLEFGRHVDDWHILLETNNSGVRLEGPQGNYTVLSGWDITQADAHWRETSPGVWEVYVVGVGTPLPDDGQGPRAILAYGPTGGPYTEQLLTLEHPVLGPLEPSGAAVYADDERLAIALSGVSDQPSTCGISDPYTVNINTTYCVDDNVGWILYGWP